MVTSVLRGWQYRFEDRSIFYEIMANMWWLTSFKSPCTCIYDVHVYANYAASDVLCGVLFYVNNANHIVVILWHYPRDVSSISWHEPQGDKNSWRMLKIVSSMEKKRRTNKQE